jgi:hypothetical protein
MSKNTISMSELRKEWDRLLPSCTTEKPPECWLTNAQLAKLHNLSEPRISFILRDLTKQGKVEVKKFHIPNCRIPVPHYHMTDCKACTKQKKKG